MHPYLESAMKMHQNEYMFGPAILEITCGIFYNQDIFPMKHIVSFESITDLTWYVHLTPAYDG